MKFEDGCKKTFGESCTVYCDTGFYLVEEDGSTVPKGKKKLDCEKPGKFGTLPTCKAQECTELKDPNDDKSEWNDICSKEVGKECKKDSKEGPQCVCKTGFKDDPANKGNCIAQECTDLKDPADKNSKWNDICSKDVRKECQKDNNIGTQCVCKPGFKNDPDNEGKCKATCEMTHSDKKSWTQHCEGIKDMKCDESGDWPKCICKEEKHKQNILGECIPRICTDNVAGETGTWNKKCTDQKKVCVFKDQVFCAEKDCNSEKEPKVTFSADCQKTDKKRCVEHETGDPTCECLHGKGGDNCKATLCSGVRSNGKTWNSYCEEIEHAECDNGKEEGDKITAPKCNVEKCLGGFHKEGDGNNAKCTATTCKSNKDGGDKTWTKYCEEDGKKSCAERSGKEPMCVGKTCTDVNTKEKMTWNDYCHIQKKKCQPNAETEDPSCIVRFCEVNRNPANGNSDCLGKPKEEGEKCNFKCDYQYKIKDNPTLTCKAKGQWDFPVPTCEKDSEVCDKPTDTNLILDEGCIGKKGEQCTVRCQKGFILYNENNPLDKDDEEITCQESNKKWSETLTCKKDPKIKCDKPKGNQLQIEGDCGGEKDEHCTVSCRNGYQFDDDKFPSPKRELKCEVETNEDGTDKDKGSYGKIPVCKPRCEINKNKETCKKFGLSCRSFNSNDKDQSMCNCNSPYLKWKNGDEGCMYWQSAFTMEIGGIRTHQQFFSKDLAKTTFNTWLKSKFPEFPEAKCNEPANSLMTCNLEVFHGTPMKTEIEKTFNEVKCAENDDATYCLFEKILIQPELFKKVKMTEKKGPCNSKTDNNCPDNSICVADRISPLTFTCKCDPDDIYKDTLGFSGPPNVFTRPDCKVKNCKDFQKGNVLWTTYCEGLGDKKRSCKEEGIPKCVCNNAYVEENNKCIDKTCRHIGADGATYNSMCEIKGMNCFDEPGKGIKCDCKSGYREESGRCVAMTCSDKNNQWNDYCTNKNSNEKCQSSEGRMPRCVCEDNYERNDEQKCVNVEKCDSKSSEGKTYEALCTDKKEKCFKPVGLKPICVATTCSSIREGTETYEAFCNKGKGKCQLGQMGEPECACNADYDWITDKCEVQTCDGNKETGKTWSEHCEDLLGTNYLCKQPPAVEGTDRKPPECGCKEGYKPVNGKCILQKCGDKRSDDKTWTEHCAANTDNNKICFEPLNKIPDCIEKNCGSERDAGKTWKNYCEEEKNRKCVQNENGIPDCDCDNGYDKVADEKCEAMSCDEKKFDHATEACETKKLDGECQVKCDPGYEGDGTVKCVVEKKGVAWNKATICKAKKCPELTVQNAEASCKNTVYDTTCKITCKHGFKLEGGEAKCILNENVLVWENAPNCTKNDKVVCKDLTTNAGFQFLSDKERCKNPEDGFNCRFKCTGNSKLIDKSGNILADETLTCKKNDWDKPVPECKAMCLIPEFKAMCDKYSLGCKADATNLETLCDCNSEHLKWVPGRGCIFWEKSVSVTLAGIKYPGTTYYADNNLDVIMQAILEKPLNKEVKNLGSFKVQGCVKNDADLVSCNVNLFLTQFVEASDVQKELVKMGTDCQSDPTCGVSFDTKVFKPALPKDLGSPCDSGKQCDKYHVCQKDEFLSTAFTCKCLPIVLKAIPFSGNMDLGLKVDEACQDVDECVENNPCDAKESDCVNRYASHICRCKGNFVDIEGKCKDVCSLGKCDKDSKCVSVEGSPSYTCKCPDGKTGIHCTEVAPRSPSDDDLSKAKTNLAVVGAVLGVILFITLVVSIVSIFKLRKRTKELANSQSDRVEMARRQH